VASSSFGVQWGALLVDTQPLEMQGDRCGMCHYCFADLNVPDRKINLPSILNRLKNFRERKDYASKLLQWGFATTISNHIDPFGSANARYFLPIMEMMSNLELPIKVQTKGGKNAWKALEFLPKKTGWYITVTTDDADIAKKQEPGAPPPEERLELAAELVRREHGVTLAINPFVPDWVPDPERLIKAVAATGVKGVWIQTLHFSNTQVSRLTPRGRSAIGEDLIKRVAHKKLEPEYQRHYDNIVQLAVDHGLHLARVGNGDYSEYHEVYHDIFPRTFPVMQDWVNWCHTFKKPFDYVTFDEFCEVLTPWLPEGKLPIKDHLAATNRFDMFKGMGMNIPPARMTYGELLRWYWERKDFKASAINATCFSMPVVEGENLDGDPILDEKGIPKLLFYPGPLADGVDPDAQPFQGKYQVGLPPFKIWMDR